MDSQPSLTPGGEFRDPERENRYRAERLPEWRRNVRLGFLCAALVTPLFFINDYLRFLGQPHFAAAVTARLSLVLASLACFAAAGRARSHLGLRALCLAWCAVAAPACAVLLSQQTEAALFFLFVLPIIFALALPLPFALAAAISLLGSGLALAARASAGDGWSPELGLGLSLLAENALLLLLLSRANRFRRLEWAARQAERAANEDLSDQRLLLQSLLEAVPAPLLVLGRNGGLLRANAAAHAYFGEEALADPATVRACFSPEDLAKLTAPCPEGQSAEFETQIRLPDGSAREVLLSLRNATVQDQVHTLAMFVDITRRKEMEARLEVLASTDPLTGLDNRTRFFAAAEQELRRAQRHGQPPSVLMLDIDHFKQINDTCGHEAGDQALRRVAALLRTLLRSQDLAARLGGEEFALLLPETGRDGALALAQRIRRAVQGLRLDGLAAGMTVSLGVSQVLPGETAVNAALARADKALYAAKAAGRNRAVLYDGA